jgi:hypothetical protein
MNGFKIGNRGINRGPSPRGGSRALVVSSRVSGSGWWEVDPRPLPTYQVTSKWASTPFLLDPPSFFFSFPHKNKKLTLFSLESKRPSYVNKRKSEDRFDRGPCTSFFYFQTLCGTLSTLSLSLSHTLFF